MAKKNSGETYSKATINKADGTITEYIKEEVNTYSIDELLSRWDGIEGITLSIKQDATIKPIKK